MQYVVPVAMTAVDSDDVVVSGVKGSFEHLISAGTELTCSLRGSVTESLDPGGDVTNSASGGEERSERSMSVVSEASASFIDQRARAMC